MICIEQSQFRNCIFSQYIRVMPVHVPVDAADFFDDAREGTDVVRYHEDGQAPVQFQQHPIQPRILSAADAPIRKRHSQTECRSGESQRGAECTFSWIGKGDLAKAKKDLATKDERIARLKEQIKKLQAERAATVQRHQQELAKLRNGYQAEIDKAIKEAESLRKTLEAKDARIEQQSKRIAELDREANPQRYRLSSGADLVKVNIPNYDNPSLHIWTRVGDEQFDDVKFQIDYNLAQRHFNHRITDEELVNAVFEPQEQVSPAQIDLLGAAFILASAGPAQTRIGTGAGGSHSDLPWDGKKNTNRKR